MSTCTLAGTSMYCCPQLHASPLGADSALYCPTFARLTADTTSVSLLAHQAKHSTGKQLTIVLNVPTCIAGPLGSRRAMRTSSLRFSTLACASSVNASSGRSMSLQHNTANPSVSARRPQQCVQMSSTQAYSVDLASGRLARRVECGKEDATITHNRLRELRTGHANRMKQRCRLTETYNVSSLMWTCSLPSNTEALICCLGSGMLEVSTSCSQTKSSLGAIRVCMCCNTSIVPSNRWTTLKSCWRMLYASAAVCLYVVV